MTYCRAETNWFSILLTGVTILIISASLSASPNLVSVHLVRAAVDIESSNGGSASASADGIAISTGNPCMFTSSHDRGVFSAAVANTDCENMSTGTKGANPQHDRGTCSFAYDRDESVFAAARSGSDCRDLGVEKNQMDTVREENIISSFFTMIYDFISQLSSQLLQVHV